jgi:hypothetical protein
MTKVMAVQRSGGIGVARPPLRDWADEVLDDNK